MYVRSVWQQRLICLWLLCLPVGGFAAEADSPAVQHTRPPAIAVIIDDLGNRQSLGRRVVSLPGPVACSFLPDGSHTGELALLAYDNGKEIMLHLPMQALGQGAARRQAGELTAEMGREEFLDTLAHDIAAVPHASGVNNHRGSLLTQQTGNMAWLMQALHEFGELFFVDSRTTRETVAQSMAHAYGVPSASRNVFLDNDPSPDAVRSQFRRLLEMARRDGTALAIGHPHPGTLDVLAEELPRLEQQGVLLLPVSQLIARQQERRLAWQGSSSR